MAQITIDYGDLPNGKTLEEMIIDNGFKNAGSGSSAQNFSSVVGKKYLVIASRSNNGTVSNAGISSGATVETVLVDNRKNQGSTETLYIAIVKATATTITMLGTGNISLYMELE